MTRHNAGFMLADLLTDHWGFPPFRSAGLSAITAGARGGHDIRVAKPRTQMNRSGRAVADLVGEEGFDVSRDLLVIADDFALPLGTFRLRARGTAGGHNGLRSVEEALRTQEYARLRIGIGPLPSEIADSADFVLEPFAREEFEMLTDVAPVMGDAVDCWIAEGIEEAMNRYNRRGSQSE